jgi:hypothetical protein
VDGIALKRAVDAWASAPADQHSAAFAAAEAVRWIEIAMNSFSFFLAGPTLFLFYGGFAPSIVKLVGLLLLVVWTFVMAFLMWRNGGRSRRIAGPESVPQEAPQQAVSPI